ncbi:substrate-binding and vWA domain-containing protein [Streptomyces litchfieldiae]|uniref:Substrate-binding and VWA domain-containing protein n=1 Tax=Streptomyces litchfieldiae TaxID=3075543 RepID=A0ABU2MTF7_9ACTN|nr:substrate-binding and VWA domain-containing protein [Streptomyces sp. DSM 44938]MDT0344921.1 substrate-binding and VWA domain-containing protein [Streptomyces sp. DSM 44938]
MRPGTPRRRAAALLTALALALTTAAACSGDSEDGDGGGSDGPRTVRILASSELADTEPLLERAAEETGVRADITWSGTLDATRLVTSGEADGEYDALWLATNDYLRLHPEAAERIVSETSIVTSPVALGFRPTVLDRLGWEPEDVTWGAVHRAAASGELTFGMTDPLRSNSGYSALISVTSALSGAQSALTQQDIDDSGPELREFFTGQRLTSGSSGWLATAFAERPDVDALINYESVLMSRAGPGTGDLTVVRPTDGVVTARYPLTVLTSASPESREALRDLTEYLRGDDAQRTLTEDTLRRPVATGVAPAAELPADRRRELPYPGSLEVADGLLAEFDHRLRRPSRTVYVLDTSASMEGERLAELKEAMGELTGTAGSPPGERFRDREEVTLMPFNSDVVSVTTHTVAAGDPEPALADIRAEVAALTAEGDTAVYRSLMEAYEFLTADGASDAFTSIVLMTDGENRDSVTAEDFEAFHRELPAEQRAAIPVFTVLFGDGDRDELGYIAGLTGGELFDAVREPLGDAFREIRGYQ